MAHAADRAGRAVTGGAPASRTLVVAPNWLGDAVMAIPFFRALCAARPPRSVAALAPRGPAALLRAVPGVEVIPRGGSLAADALALRRRGFDEAWLLPNSFRAAAVAWLSGAQRRIGYATDRRSALLTDAVPRPLPTGHQLRDYDRLLLSRGVEPDRDPPRLPVPEAAQARADAALAVAGLAAGPTSRLVLLAPGAAFAWTKRWPPQRWGALAARLAKSGVSPALVIGPGEEPLAAEAVAASGLSALPVLGADLDPLELAGLLARARVVAANDSGPMHLAAAAGTPVVAIFGPTDPGRTAPSGAPFRALDRYVFCSPCFLKDCPYRHECMTGIHPETVAAAIEELFSASA
ncbi:MAG: lipopolysaccharide heptosyltransferase II [Acidobacteriota bacterium]